MKEVHIPHLGRAVKLHPHSQIRRQKPCRTLVVPRHLKGVTPLPTPPAVIDYSKGNTLAFPIDGNDQYGDCWYAAGCHGSNAMTGNVGGAEDYFDEKAIVTSYLRLSGGDNGLSTDQMMGEWKKGLCGGPHKIIDDMSVNPTDTQAMALALWLFGGIGFTLGIPDAWLSDPKPGDIWDGGPGVSANDANGHAVWFTGKNGNGFQLQTWGFNPPVTITESGVRVCDPEATAVFSLDWFDSTGKAPNGFTYDQLASFWVQLGGNALPPSPFGPAPAPTPTPAPPPPAPPPVASPMIRTLGTVHPGLMFGLNGVLIVDRTIPIGDYLLTKVN